ncbi:unnamed protein product [Schistosoma margrebowiei]|uniref:Uncharacterized protein n=1 Tax=Schistosoma margrebowiei TaxID=48269 RepID=A0A183LKH2_9TREM|nr:unnamed protein product [Schistosoma margrebowiei]
MPCYDLALMISRISLARTALFSCKRANMRLFVRSHLGGQVVISVGPTESVKSLKDKISVVTGIRATTQSLYHQGSLLLDDGFLEDFGIADLDNVDVNCELRGGGKKRKKKNYTTPKKIKHKKKKVDSNGKVTRLRRECPNEKCGAGVFMASHFDREYCGKCTLTYKHVN